MFRAVPLLPALLLAAIFVVAAPASSVRTSDCVARDLVATFVKVPKSEGGGLVAYALKVTNSSAKACKLGFAQIRLLDARGKRLPTTDAPESTGDLTPTVLLKPGASATQTAHFSATYPGQGEPVTGPCEPAAHLIRVAFGRAQKPLETPVQPPTPVCSNGMLIVGAVTLGRSR